MIMKNLFLILSVMIIFSLNTACQSKQEVPETVKKAFSQKFPDATKVKWDMENSDEWEAEFKLNGKEYSANFNMAGKWLETEFEVEMKDLPEAVKTTLKKEFDGFKIEEMEMSETSGGNVYEFEIEKGDLEMEITIDPDGKVLNQAVENEESENKEDDD